jgi:hypothetical protein
MDSIALYLSKIGIKIKSKKRSCHDIPWYTVKLNIMTSHRKAVGNKKQVKE